MHRTLPKPPVLGDKPTQVESAAKASQREEAMEVGIEDFESLPSRPPVKETEGKGNRTGEKEQEHGYRLTSGNDQRGGTEGHEALASAPRVSEPSLGQADKHAPA